MKQDYSDEMLNAYLDDELASVERAKLIDQLRSDMALRKRVCQLEQVRNMVKIAYHDVGDDKPEHHNLPRKTASIAAIAASVFIIVGALAGWYGHQQLNQKQSLVELAEYLEYNQPVSDAQPWRVLMHVTSDDPYRLNILLDEAEKILRQHQARQQKVAIQILANGRGLNMLNSKTSVYGKRIAELQKKYDNIVFMACAKAIERIKNEKGLNVELLPNTHIAPSALHEVLQKQREGWTYIKI